MEPTKAALHQAHAVAQAAALGVKFGPKEQVSHHRPITLRETQPDLPAALPGIRKGGRAGLQHDILACCGRMQATLSRQCAIAIASRPHQLVRSQGTE